MIITEILGNTHDAAASAAYEGHHRERVVLPSADLAKRIQRVRTDHGTELGIRLPPGSPDLRDGDVLAAEPPADGKPGNVVVVSVEATDVLVIAPRGIGEALFAAHSLGNRHLQAQFSGHEMVCQYDHTVVDFLDHHGVPYTREDRVMAVPFRHAGHTH
jgi:urease accessory protein